MPDGRRSRTTAARNSLASARAATRTDDRAYERIGAMVEPQPDGCWLYRGVADDYGFAPAPGGGQQRAHRLVYEILRGPIDDGCHLHHECERPGCVNPDHLTVMTPGDHSRRHAELRRQHHS